MSNTAVGLVYETIIAEVINSVRVDFEENGVDDGALEDLKKVRLSLSPSLSLLPSRPTAAPSRCTSTTLPRVNRTNSFRNLSWSRSLSSDILSAWGRLRWLASVTSVGLPSRRLALTPRARGGGEQPARVGDPVLLGLFLRRSSTAADSPNHSPSASDWPSSPVITCTTLEWGVAFLCRFPSLTQPSPPQSTNGNDGPMWTMLICKQ